MCLNCLYWSLAKKEVLRDVNCNFQNDYMISFEAFKPMINQLDKRRELKRRQRIMGGERYPS